MEVESLQAAQRALEDRYRIERPLGSGAMATVYLAEDLRHSRAVALKILKTEVASALGVGRFAQEIEIAARLRHPQILPLFDSGTSNGIAYYVMPLVRGETLRQRLLRERQLPLADAISLATDIAGALAYAHTQGVIHRDIKPENILLEDGRPVLADFGVARAITVAGGERLTQTGIAVGTPIYMSPEQAAGEALDRRSDLYALACVLYEMLAGEPPFSGPSAQAILARKATQQVPPLRTVRDTVSPEVERVILKALARTPADRFATVEEFARALERAVEAKPTPRALSRPVLLAAMSIVSVIATAGGWWAVRHRPVGSGRIESLVVLPFENLSTDSATNYFADGVHASMIGELGRISALRVVPRSTAIQYKDTHKAIADIVRELGIDAAVEGSTVKFGDSVRVYLRLIRASPEQQMWAGAFDAEFRDVLTLQREAIRAIVDRAQITLTPEERARLAKARPINSAAHDAYLKGLYQANSFTPEGIRKGIESLEQAARLDADDPLPYVGLAMAYIQVGLGHGNAVARHEAFSRATAAAQRALQLDETLADAHAALGTTHLFYDWDWAGAEREIQRAIALNPNSAMAHWTYALYLNAMRRFDEAIDENIRAQTLDKLSRIIIGDVAVRYYVAGRYDEAIIWAKKSLDLEPNFPPSLWVLGAAYREKGLYNDAIKAHERAAAGNSLFKGQLAHTYASAGRIAEARKVLASLDDPTKRAYAMFVAEACVALGDRQEALRWLEIAYQEHDPFLHWIRLEPALVTLRSERRYQELLRRLHLPPQ